MYVYYIRYPRNICYAYIYVYIFKICAHVNARLQHKMYGTIQACVLPRFAHMSACMWASATEQNFFMCVVIVIYRYCACEHTCTHCMAVVLMLARSTAEACGTCCTATAGGNSQGCLHNPGAATLFDHAPLRGPGGSC